MRAPLLVALAVVASALLAGCTDPAPSVTANPLEPCGALATGYEVDERYDPFVRFVTDEGEFRAVVFLQQVPVTAGNFLTLVRQGFYNDTRFHLLRADELVQGGDPLSASDNKNFWGTGGPGYQLPDEFHAHLRHDEPGTLSMAGAGPNTGGSQFFVHLVPRPDLDDRHPVFARVVEGEDVVARLSNTPVDERERPQFNARLYDATIEPPERDPRDATVSLSSYGFDCDQVATPGGQAEFLVAVRNIGQRVLDGAFEDDAPAGWGVTLRNAETVAVPAGQTVAYILNVDVPANATVGTTHTIPVRFSDTESDAATSLALTVRVGELGPSPRAGEAVAVDYVGVLEDGRPFDTTREEYAGTAFLDWFKPPPTRALFPLEFEIQDGRLIPGFDRLADRGQLGQTVVAAIPPESGYGSEAYGQSNLGGRLLIFQMQLVQVGDHSLETVDP